MWPFSKIKELEKDVRELQKAILAYEDKVMEFSGDIPVLKEHVRVLFKAVTIERSSRDCPSLCVNAIGSMSELHDRINELYAYLGVTRTQSPAKTELVKRITKK